MKPRLSRVRELALVALVVLGTGCSEALSPDSRPADPNPTDSIDPRMKPETWLNESLSPEFEEMVRNSPEAAILQSQGKTLRYSEGVSIYPDEPVEQCFDVSLVPMTSKQAIGDITPHSTLAWFMYTYDSQSQTGVGRVLELIPGRSNSTLRLHHSVDAGSYFDIVVDADGIMVDYTVSQGKWGVNWDCVVPKVITAIQLGQSTGVGSACVTACTAGGAANPGCVGCIVGAAGLAAFIIWDCWEW